MSIFFRKLACRGFQRSSVQLAKNKSNRYDRPQIGSRSGKRMVQIATGGWFKESMQVIGIESGTECNQLVSLESDPDSERICGVVLKKDL